MKRPATNPSFYEVEVAPGLEPVVYQELLQQFGASMRLQQPMEALINRGIIPIRYPGDARRLIQLATVFNVYLIVGYNIPRPKTLLAQEHFDRLIMVIQQVMNLSPHLRYYTFGISAAGSDSPVLQELCERLAAKLGIIFAAEEVDLLLRLRPAHLQQDGWEVLIRLTPRPLSVRPWRVADMKGALMRR